MQWFERFKDVVAIAIAAVAVVLSLVTVIVQKRRIRGAAP